MKVLKEEIFKIIDKKRNYSGGGGVSVVNCILHRGMPYSERPDECRSCQSDRTNFIIRAEKVNDFLNGLFNDLESIASELLEEEEPIEEKTEDLNKADNEEYEALKEKEGKWINMNQGGRRK